MEVVVEGGFFNALNEDRLYSAESINNFFEGLIGPGIILNVDGALQVRAGDGMKVFVQAGRLIDSKGRWLRNRSTISLEIDPPDVLLNRHDAVVAAIDSSVPIRAAKIYIKKGVAEMVPVAPDMIRNGYLEEFCLATVYVSKNVTSITQSAITDTRSNNYLCGFAAGLIEQIDTSSLFSQFKAAFDEWFDGVKERVPPSWFVHAYQSLYTTIGDKETHIPINIPQFNKELDILYVYINGLRLVPGTDYTVHSSQQITLANDVKAGTVIFFEVLKY